MKFSTSKCIIFTLFLFAKSCIHAAYHAPKVSLVPLLNLKRAFTNMQLQKFDHKNSKSMPTPEERIEKWARRLDELERNQPLSITEQWEQARISWFLKKQVLEVLKLIIDE